MVAVQSKIHDRIGVTDGTQDVIVVSRRTQDEPAEIVLHHDTGTSHETRSGNSIQMANYYPTVSYIAYGQTYAVSPSHLHVHTGFLEHACAEKQEIQIQSSSTEPPIHLFKLGKDIFIQVNNHANELQALAESNTDPQQQDVDLVQAIIAGYLSAAQCAQSRLSSGGEIVLLADDRSTRAVATVISSFYGDKDISCVIRDTKNLVPQVSGHIDGTDYIIRIEPSTTMTSDQLNQLLDTYEAAIRMAASRAESRGGRVILQADAESQKLIAKLLGRLHQVDSGASGQSGAEYIRKAIRESDAGRHLKNPNTGTRYFFIEDIENLITLATLPPHDSSMSDQTQRSEVQHRDHLLKAVKELTQFLNTNNRTGSPEGQVFLVNANKTVITDRSKLQQWGTKFSDIEASIIASSQRWLDDQPRVLNELISIAKELRENCHPAFHKVDLQSPLFVEVVNRVLRSDSATIDFGEAVSTPLIPLEVGYFDPDNRNERVFKITSTDPEVCKTVKWLFDQQATKVLQEIKASLLPSDADYLVIYKPGSPITQPAPSTKRTARFGYMKPAQAFVVEWGTADGKMCRILIDSNVESPRALETRAKKLKATRESRGASSKVDKTIAGILGLTAESATASSYSAFDLARHTSEFRDSQHRCFEAVLSAMNGTRVKLAPRHSIVSIANPVSEDSRLRLFVDGKRLDLMQFTELDVDRLTDVLVMKADLMAAGIIAQLPHLMPHELVISADNETKAVQALTYLSSEDSFCHSSRVKSAEQYLTDIVPALCGNAIARHVAPIGYTSSSQRAPAIQSRLIYECVSQIENRLKELSSTEQQNTNSRERIFAVFDAAEAKDPKEPDGYRPRMLNIGTYLPTSRELLTIMRSKLKELCEAITKYAVEELELIKQIAPSPNAETDLEGWQEVDQFAKAVSSLIGRHVPEGKKSREAINTFLRQAIDLKSLSIAEKTWCITLLDVQLRMEELHQKVPLGQSINAAFRSSADSQSFFKNLTEHASDLNLTFETITGLYQALSGLTAAYRADSCSDEKRDQLNMILKGMSAFNRIVTSNS